MKLSVTSWSFPQCDLAEAASIARAIGLDGIDLGYFYRAALDKDRLLAEPQAYGAELRRALPLPAANLYHLFGADPAERNLAQSPPDARNLADFNAALAFCRAVGAPTIFVLPGLLGPGQSRASALASTAEALKPMVEAADGTGVTVTVEPHVHSYLESPELAAALIDKVPGLALTLDPAHFAVIGYRQDEIEALVPHAGHVHLRQARPGALQAKMEEGTLNFPAFFAALRDAGYDGWLAIEYVHQAYMATVHDDVLSETVRMRDAFRAWSAA
ncbi:MULTISPECIES: sugar phosphate isomerase/epimerase family protein [unclassified Roseitalea]|uniref:sugar phosphate isomerase/epimerase family protein n=1 Tax=unclassified Roseitalea TaxID=2639107 RepID=UPI00273F60B3|nr:MULTISPECIES: sugar phosphate isomerase/epimerase family protein [unclassified Roseitalea]